MSLHPAENRGYRELYAYARQIADHWAALGARLPGSPVAQVLLRGAAAGRQLVDELTPLTARYGLHGEPAAQGAGASIARKRSGVRDRFLERNQAVRFAVEDAQHLVTLLVYLAAVSRAAGNHDLADFAGGWERRLRRIEQEARRSVADLAEDLDGAVAPLDPSGLGRAAHSLGTAMGTAGEWFDRRAAQRRG